jgi:purine-binding chemotaxis protein CheW
MTSKEYDDRTCVVVIDFDGISIGLIVDSVSEVITLPDEYIVDLPGASTGLGNRYIKNIGKADNEVILLLDCQKLLSEDELATLNEIL